MLNYIKSEGYRVLHDKGVYLFTFILTISAFLLNFLLFWFRKIDGESFPYATTSFSYSNLVANPMVFCMMGALVAAILYEGSKKNGNLKNTISFGISRIKVFAGECIVASITSCVILLIVLTVYSISAILLLEPTGPVTLLDLLSEVPAVFLLAIASLISAIVCIDCSGKASTGIVVWFLIWFLIPKAFFYLGLRVSAMHSIAMWMPANFFGTTAMIVNRSFSITAWESAAGMMKCISAGMIGILVFSLAGVVFLRKRDL